MKKTNLTFEKLSKRMGFVFKCTCESVKSNDLKPCKCISMCYCTEFQQSLVVGVSHYLKTQDTKLIVSAFQLDTDMIAPGEITTLTMLDCADFIHRLNLKLPKFSDITTDD